MTTETLWPEHAETALVAAAMTGVEAVEFIRHQLGGIGFHSMELQSYWEICCDIADNGQPMDLVTIADEMVRRHGRESVVRLADIYSARWEAGHVSHYCQQLLAAHQKRATQALGRQLASDRTPDYDAYITSLDSLRQRDTDDISSAADAVAEMQEAQNNPAAIHATGITQLDQMLGGGIKDAQICVVAGRPGSGKTVLMLQMALGAIAKGDSVLVVSLEMLKGELMERLSKGIPVDRLAALPMHFIDTTSNLQTITALARIAHKRHGVGLIVIDYLQLLEVRTGRNSHREEQVATASRAIKRLAMDLRCPIIVGSQLNRAGAENPTLSSLRESGSIEQDASQVILIKDPTEYGEPSKMILAKNRNGKTGNFSMSLNGSRYIFEASGNASADDADAAWR